MYIQVTSEKWYFVTKITVRKICYIDPEKLDIRGRRPRICKHFEITKIFYLNNERSEQFLVTKCFFKLRGSWRFPISNKLEQL